MFLISNETAKIIIPEQSIIQKLGHLTNNFEGKTITGIEELTEHYQSILSGIINITALGLYGIPGSGKGYSEKVPSAILQKKLFRTKRYDDGTAILNSSLGRIFKTGETFAYEKRKLAILHTPLDGFFGAIGEEKYNIMLQNEKMFRLLFSQEDKIMMYLSKFLSTNESFSIPGIYSKESAERLAQMGFGEIRVKKSNNGVDKLIILDGVNAYHLLNIYEQIILTKLKTEKILIIPDLFRAFTRLMDRDIFGEKKGRGLSALDKNLQLRLEETYYVIKCYILPSLEKGDITMLDLSEVVSHLNKESTKIIINGLDKNKDIILSKANLEQEKREFVEEYADFLINRLQAEIS